MSYVFTIIITVLVIYLILSNIRIVPQEHAYIIERLGMYVSEKSSRRSR